MARSDSSCGTTAHLIALGAACGLIGYGMYKLFSNPDAVRRLGPLGERVADGVESLKRSASDLADTAREQAGDALRTARAQAGGAISAMGRAAGRGAADAGQQMGESVT